MTDLNNKTAFITGGSKGIGYGIAKSMIENGMNVAITSRTQQSADQAAAALNKLGKGEAIGIEADVRDADAQEEAVQNVISKWGTLDVVIANAGLGHFGSIEDLSIEQWNETIDTNLSGVFYTVKSSLEYLKKSKGYIITISSLAGTNFFAGGAAYNASKFGLTGFTQAVMLDVRKHGIRVSTIMPGSVSTHFNNNDPAEKDDWKIQIEDIGEMVINLLKLDPRTLPSKIEVRPSSPPS